MAETNAERRERLLRERASAVASVEFDGARIVKRNLSDIERSLRLVDDDIAREQGLAPRGLVFPQLSSGLRSGCR